MNEKLDAILHRAFVDAYNIYERAVGLATVISDGIQPPFSARVVGVDVQVMDTDIRDTGFLDAPAVICERGGQRYAVDVLDLEDWQRTGSVHYIAAYRKSYRLPPWDGQSPTSDAETIVSGGLIFEVRRPLLDVSPPEWWGRTSSGRAGSVN